MHSTPSRAGRKVPRVASRAKPRKRKAKIPRRGRGKRTPRTKRKLRAAPPKKRVPKRVAAKKRAPKKRSRPVKRAKRSRPVKPKTRKRAIKPTPDHADAVVITGSGKVAPDYRPFVPKERGDHKRKPQPTQIYADAMRRLRAVFEKVDAGTGEIAIARAREIVDSVSDEDESGPDDQVWAYDRDSGEVVWIGPEDDTEEIEWFPTFDEVYDYIDGLCEEFPDLDAHELFEMAFGYDTDQAS